MGAPPKTLRLQSQLSCMGWAAGTQAGCWVRELPKERAGCFRTEKPAAARGRGALHAKGEPHGLAEKISFTREGRRWQESPVVLSK